MFIRIASRPLFTLVASFCFAALAISSAVPLSPIA